MAQTNAPPEWVKGLFERAAQDTMRLYNQESGKAVWQKSGKAVQRVAGFK
ncbi:hypothetical protein [Bartonella saheliensis]|nr:hypothetical protein [Bartonella saheliensis]